MMTSEAKFQMKIFKNLVRYEKTSNSLLNNLRCTKATIELLSREKLLCNYGVLGKQD